MRVISQDGMVDLPYENIGISINHHSTTDIIAYPVCNYSSDSEFWIMALYSTEAKAKKAMEMLRNVYLEYEKGMSTEYWFAFNFPKIFQFPQDEDVEV